MEELRKSDPLAFDRTEENCERMLRIINGETVCNRSVHEILAEIKMYELTNEDIYPSDLQLLINAYGIDWRYKLENIGKNEEL